MPIPVEISFQQAPPWTGTYVYANFADGSVGATYYLSIFNPVGSGKNIVLLSFVLESYSVAVSAALNQLVLRRITAVSGGTLDTAITKFRSSDATSVVEVRTFPTAATDGNNITVFSPNQNVTAVGTTGVSRREFRLDPAWGEFLLVPGEGVILRQTAAGDVDQKLNLTAIWAER